jgi:importin-5
MIMISPFKFLQVLGSEFAQYYAPVMQEVRKYALESDGQISGVMRGKAFECVAMMGRAVGQAAFKQDALAIMQKMVG